MLTPEERDPAYLWEIHRAALEAEILLRQPRADGDLAHRTTCYALAHVLEKLGRFTGKLSESLRDAHPEVDWTRLARFERGLRLDDELRPDCEKIWAAVEEDLPGVADAVERLIPPLPEEVEGWVIERAAIA